MLVEVYSVSVDKALKAEPYRLGSSTKLSYRPTKCYQSKTLDLYVSLALLTLTENYI